MTIDNSNFAIKDRKQFYMMIIFLTVSLPIIFLADPLDEEITGIPRIIWALIAIIIYLAVNIYRFVLDYHFVNYSDAGEKLVFKYYTLRPFMQKRMSIEIQKSNFVKFEILTSVFGKKKTLILFQKINKNLAKYPPISLSALSSEDISKLRSSLNSLARR